MSGQRAPHALRVAIVGAGPAGFYAAAALLEQERVAVEVDLFDRLPTPYGLVRYGVAPDHQRIKTVVRAFEQTAADPRVRFFGGVEFGRDILLEDIQRHYHQLLVATGAQTDRRMGIPGEDLRRSHAATEFVAWYNGHPYYAGLRFDLGQERVAIVGAGNVAIDVARILCLSPEELAKTDIAQHALEALQASKVREVHVLARRGPAQAAFTNPEVKELGELAGADVVVRPDEAALDPLSAAEVEASDDRALARKVDILREYAARRPGAKPRRLFLRFLVSPEELLDDGSGAVASVRLARNCLVHTPAGSVAAEATGETEVLEAGLVFRSVGYRGVPLPGVPFNERWGTVLHIRGRICNPQADGPLPGMYAAGWIKRGPSGVIGTNKPDAAETVLAMVEDALEERTFQPSAPAREAVEDLLQERGVPYVSFADWLRIDESERAAGAASNRPRLKFTSVGDMLAACGVA